MHVPDFDLIVIGGGPAGSCAAALARQKGLSVAVIEREVFPRFHIGESLLPAGNRVLQDVGVWPKLEAAGFIHKYGARFILADGSMEKRIDFSRGHVRDLGRTFQVERAKFDEILLNHAKVQGAEVKMPATVVGLTQAENHVRVEIREKPGAPTSALTASWVIDAGGRENHFPCDPKRALDTPRFPRRVAVYSHFRGMSRAAGKPGGDTIVVRLADGWFWVIPIDAEKTSVGLVTTTEALRTNGGEPAAVFARAIEDSPYLRDLFGDAEPAMGFHVTADYSYFRRKLAFGRVLLVGDAGGFFDPIFSSGVYMAMSGAQRAVELVATKHRQRTALTERECRRYARAVKSHAGVFARLIETFYDNDSIAIFLSSQPPFDLERGLTSIVAGHARLTFPLWWRFNFFLAVCALNKRIRLAPRINIAASVASGRPEPSETNLTGTHR